jgi:hypothetical protein
MVEWNEPGSRYGVMLCRCLRDRDRAAASDSIAMSRAAAVRRVFNPEDLYTVFRGEWWGTSGVLWYRQNIEVEEQTKNLASRGMPATAKLMEYIGDLFRELVQCHDGRKCRPPSSAYYMQKWRLANQQLRTNSRELDREGDTRGSHPAFQKVCESWRSIIYGSGVELPPMFLRFWPIVFDVQHRHWEMALAGLNNLILEVKVEVGDMEMHPDDAKDIRSMGDISDTRPRDVAMAILNKYKGIIQDMVQRHEQVPESEEDEDEKEEEYDFDVMQFEYDNRGEVVYNLVTDDEEEVRRIKTEPRLTRDDAEKVRARRVEMRTRAKEKETRLRQAGDTVYAGMRTSSTDTDSAAIDQALNTHALGSLLTQQATRPHRVNPGRKASQFKPNYKQ